MLWPSVFHTSSAITVTSAPVTTLKRTSWSLRRTLQIHAVPVFGLNYAIVVCYVVVHSISFWGCGDICYWLVEALRAVVPFLFAIVALCFSGWTLLSWVWSSFTSGAFALSCMVVVFAGCELIRVENEIPYPWMKASVAGILRINWSFYFGVNFQEGLLFVYSFALPYELFCLFQGQIWVHSAGVRNDFGHRRIPTTIQLRIIWSLRSL